MVARLLGLARARPTWSILVGRASYQAAQFALIVAPSVRLDDGSYERLVVTSTTASISVLAGMISLHTAMLRMPAASFARAGMSGLNVRVGLALSPVAVVITTLFGSRDAEGIAVAAMFALAAVANGDILLRASVAARDGSPVRSAAAELLTGVVALASCGLLLAIGARDLLTWAIASMLSAFVSWVVAIAVTHLPEGGRGAYLATGREVVHNGRIILVSGILMAAFNRVDYLVMSLVATDAESARYALATRFAGPVLVGLSALNNSLYVRQLADRDDLPRLVRHTRAFVPRVVRVAVITCAVAFAAVVLVTVAVPTFEERRLLLPTIILLGATCLFAAGVPWAYALNATERERSWLVIVAVALVADAALVWGLGRYGAVACSLCWLATQLGVLVAVQFARRSSGLAPSLSRT